MRMGLNALVGAAASRWGLPVVGLYAAAEGYQFYQEEPDTPMDELNSKLARDLVGFTAGALVGSLVFNR